uniref:C2H2-type domain-containing protein n=1 Tax=Kalanchoe fedtschenkoi TaxID=63787 RepID=A0A7N0VG17_KALFE
MMVVCYGFSFSWIDRDIDEPATGRTLEEDRLEVHCSRERSRAAWKIIEDYLMPFVETEKYQLSAKCRIHPDSDVYRDQEQHKIHFDIYEWSCGCCKKSFYAEKYLDQHFDSRHYNLLNVDSESRCLADLCGALHCDQMLNSKAKKSNLQDSCFPAHEGPSPLVSRLREFFLRQFCDAHTCSGKHKPFPRGGKCPKRVLYLTISILMLILLPNFYLIVFLYHCNCTQELKRITKLGSKKKPS